MNKAYVVEAKCLIVIHADSPEQAEELANAELEQIAFDIEFISTSPYWS